MERLILEDGGAVRPEDTAFCQHLQAALTDQNKTGSIITPKEWFPGVKEYRDHVILSLSRVDEEGEVTEHGVTQPHRAGEPYVDFSIDDLPLRFDFQTRKLQLLPLKE